MEYCVQLLGSPEQKELVQSPEKGHEDDYGTGASLIWGKAERDATL